MKNSSDFIYCCCCYCCCWYCCYCYYYHLSFFCVTHFHQRKTLSCSARISRSMDGGALQMRGRVAVQSVGKRTAGCQPERDRGNCWRAAHDSRQSFPTKVQWCSKRGLGVRNSQGSPSGENGWGGGGWPVLNEHSGTTGGICGLVKRQCKWFCTFAGIPAGCFMCWALLGSCLGTPPTGSDLRTLLLGCFHHCPVFGNSATR